MKIVTRHLGEIEVRKDDLLVFPQGIVGFEEFQSFALLKAPEEEPFVWLQSTDDPATAFVVVNPLFVDPTYDFEVDDETIALLGVKDPGEIDLYVIVTVRQDFQRMTANLLAPIIVCRTTARGRQLVLHQSSYATQHPLFPDAPAADAG
ncbi:MAG: flagellar assembly protein FliW [Myxococcales bacterium]|nr:MAG: flagellar assembly protein FliW [Myxococcales bacterium]